MTCILKTQYKFIFELKDSKDSELFLNTTINSISSTKLEKTQIPSTTYHKERTN